MACHIAFLGGFAAPAAGQTVNWHQFDPLVVPSTQIQPVLLEASVSGTPSRVNLELAAGGTIEMKDDGTGGDRRAGDGVFTASVPAAAIVGALRADDVQRVFVGFLNVFNDQRAARQHVRRRVTGTSGSLSHATTLTLTVQ